MNVQRQTNDPDMNIITFCGWIMLTATCFADPFRAAVINDPDGFTNIRAGASSSSDIVGKIKAGAVFYAEPSSGDWWQVEAQNDLSGFMNKRHITILPTPSLSGSQPTILTPADIDTSAEPTDAATQNLLGMKYFWGIGVANDSEKAAVWLQKAASQGDLAAKANLGRQMFMGNGIAKDEQLGMSMMRDAAMKGNARAELIYGVCIFQLLDANERGDSPKNKKILTIAMNWMKEGVSDAQSGEEKARALDGFNQVTAVVDEYTRELMISDFANVIDNLDRQEEESENRAANESLDAIIINQQQERDGQ